MSYETNVLQTKYVKLFCFSLLIIATLFIFLIAQTIGFYLNEYDLSSMFVSFCAGFILFIPLVSLLLHPLIFTEITAEGKSHFSVLLGNVGLVLVVQCLFFLIWMTDAIAIYSIYVDQNSFLAKAFNITSENHGNLSEHFYWANLFLACFFAWLSLIIGVLPCLIARLDNKGVVKNFVAGFSFAKRYKAMFAFASLLIAAATVLPLLYCPYLFLLSFPAVFVLVFCHIANVFMSRRV